MNWIELVSAVGVGAILAKIVDLKILQPYLAKRVRSEWLREKRFQAFDKLTKNILTFGMEKPGKVQSFYDAYAISSEALLLVDNRDLCKRIDAFIVKRQEFDTLVDDKSNDVRANKLYNEINEEARKLISEMRLELRNDET
jgi:hypothetical protein